MDEVLERALSSLASRHDRLLMAVGEERLAEVECDILDVWIVLSCWEFGIRRGTSCEFAEDFNGLRSS
jgi:hypothetical protein